jgi:hypothetical protein
MSQQGIEFRELPNTSGVTLVFRPLSATTAYGLNMMAHYFASIPDVNKVGKISDFSNQFLYYLTVWYRKLAFKF